MCTDEVPEIRVKRSPFIHILAFILCCRCEGLDVLFQQRDAARHEWEAVRPGQSTDYAWDLPLGSHKLCISIKDSSAAFRDMTTHEYSLDLIKAWLLSLSYLKGWHPFRYLYDACQGCNVNVRRYSAKLVRALHAPSILLHKLLWAP